MLNTTTIPTSESDTSILNVFYILSLGALLGASIIELFLFQLREKERDFVEADEDTEEDTEEDYCNNYKDEFAALSLRKLNEEELKQLNTKIVREQVAEKVEVIMTFDKDTDTFWYYTDKLKDVSYPILETVARKFAIENDCKIICLQEPTETHIETPIEAPIEAPTEAPIEEPIEAPTKAPSVFAKFKSYNAGKGSAPNFTSVVKVVEQMNHFRYRGKLLDYEERQTPKGDEPTLDYASYKKLLEKKEK